MNFVPCVAWVPKGKAATTPHKLQLSPEELKRLVDETKEQCNQNSDEEIDEEDDTDETSSNEGQETLEECDAADDEIDDFETRYNLDSYDNDDDENPLFTINDLAVHVDNKDDDYLTDEESEGDIEEKEDFTVKDTDNLLVVGHVEDSSSVLEIHVYNQEDDVFYVHHDIVLPSYPLALAWLDFHPSDEKPGNYVAVGDMSPVIKIWDLDVVDILEPDYTLGKVSKKNKEKKIKKEMNYHSDAVLSLSWNKQVRNLLASGSADSTVIVWDLEDGSSLNKLSFHSNKVQALEWHPTESQFLLSGCTDGFLKLYDCRSTGESKSWKVSGEIEKVTWNISDSFQFFCSTDQGYIHSVDMRNDKIEWSFQAHKEAVTGLDISPLKPDVLVSASMDKTLKVWDLKRDFKMIKCLKLKVGSIYTAKVASDQELTVAVGGNNASNSLKIINIFKDKDMESNKSFEGIKIKNEEELQKSTKQNKRKIYDAESNNSFKGIKTEKEGFQKSTKLNKRIIYDDVESNKSSKGIKFKNEEEELQKSTKPNKRKIYDVESNKDFKGIKIKNEKEEFQSTKMNKRIVYDRESNTSFRGIKTEEQGFQGSTKLNKRMIYDTESNNSFKGIKTEKEGFQRSTKLNKRIIYDTEENDKIKTEDCKSSFFDNCKKEKDFKSKK